MENRDLNLKVLDLLEDFENRLESISAIPLTGRIMIDRDEFLDLIKEINILLPEEYQHVKWIRSQKNQIIEEAQRSAESILRDSQRNAESILREAQSKEQRILSNAKL